MTNGRQKRNTKGFTMIELIVTLVLMGILLGIGMFALSGYTRFSKFKRQNETAQSLFVAAQTSLTQFVADGTAAQMTEICRDADSGAILLNKGGQMQVSLTDGAGQAVTAAGIWKKQSTDPYGVLYALMGTPQDYAAYAAGSTVSTGAKALYDLLDAYVYDKSVLKDGTVCLEFDPAEGMAYSVLYSQNAEKGFTYTGEHNKVDIRDRTQEARKERMLGYYGVDTLSKSLSALDGAPALQNLQLSNGETLDLNWTLDSGNLPLLAQLKYDVEIYDASTNNCVMKLEIHQQTHATGNDTFVAQSSASAAQTIEVTVKRATKNMASPTYISLGTYTFPAYVDSAQTVHLILDAVDLGATEYTYQLLCQNNPLTQENAANPLKNTFSMHRFLLEQLGTESIYCKLSTLADDNNQAVTPKKSNTEALYFGGRSADSSDAIVYTVQNARHLNNIRYEENEKSFHTLKESNTLRYDVAADILWNGKDGLVQNGLAYDTAVAEWATGNNHASPSAYRKTFAGLQNDGSYADVDFPGISCLRQYASFGSAEGGKKIYTISGLSLSSENDIKRLVPGVNPEVLVPDSAKATGLFLRNYGTLQNMALGDVFVTGQENVGAFCGQNCGTLQKLEVKGGNVYGLTNVGGVYGCEGMTTLALSHKVNNKILVNELTNRADVTGHRCVGGITGRVDAGLVYLHGNGGGIGNTAAVSYTLQNCSNYGVVCGDTKALAESKNAAVKALYQNIYQNGTPENDDAMYIGGIAGYSDAKVDVKNNGKHNPALETECRFLNCISAPTMSAEARDTLLTGIAADVAAGGTAQELLRGTYVGGILGYGDGAMLEASTTEKNGQEEPLIWGNRYVGGIVGWNSADVSNTTALETWASVIGRQYVGGVTGQTQAQDAAAGTAQTTVSGWTMRGVAAATEGYVGGLVGENKGRVSGCFAEMSFSDAAQRVQNACGESADYAGGLVGCNRAILENCTVTAAAVVGRSFVGGAVGCQDAAATVTACQVQSAQVTGRDFVGGYAGLNLNAALAAAVSGFTVTPGNVSGRYFVGGCFGGCLLADGSTLPAEIAISVQNAQGMISAENAYAGGYAGILALLSDAAQGALPAPRTADGSLLSGLVSLAGSDLLGDCTAVETALGAHAGSSSLVLAGAAGQTNIALGMVQAGIYGGGAAGYIPAGSKVLLRGVTNAAPVRTLQTVAGQELGNGDSARYSYAGGILGKVSRTVSLAACTNAQGTAITVPQGCCTAPLTEVNCGRIIACTVQSFGSDALSNVGGLVGTNAASGSAAAVSYNGRTYDTLGLLDCKAAGVTVTGTDRVGGLAVFNYGLIRDPELKNAEIRAGGSDAGMAAAVHGGSGAILFSAAKELSGLKVTSANRAGGLVGQCIGSATIACADGALLKVAADCTVTAGSSAGGIAGTLNGSTQIKNAENNATIRAQGSAAGGIAGSSSGLIEACANYGAVSAADSAGGIVGIQTGTLRTCTGGGTVSGAACGGIAGRNSGTIGKCSFSGTLTGTAGANESAYDPTQTLGADGKTIYGCGGIVGVNGGSSAATLENCTVSAAAIEVQGSAGSPANVGGIAGVNMASGTITNVDFGADDTQSLTVSDEGYYVGTASSPAAADAVYTGSVRVRAAVYGNVGGTVGLNAGTVTNVSVQASDTLPFAQRTPPQAKLLVYCAAGNSGGVVGCNAVGGNVSNANVGGSSVIWAAQESAASGCGGILGASFSAGTVSTCNHWGTVIKMSGGAAGGVVGYCAAPADGGVLQSCANYGAISAAGQAGGIVGLTEKVGVLVDTCANFGKITAGTDAGGILGLRSDTQASGTLTIKACENHGRVGRDAASSGIGGVIGSDTSGTASALVADCANTGLICGDAASSGGILGRCTASNGSFALQDCLNYGYAAAGSSAMTCGITPADGAAISLTECVGVAGTSVPITAAASTQVSDCFFFQAGASGSGEALACVSAEGGYQAEGALSGVVFTGLSADPSALDAQPNGNTEDGLAVLDGADNARYQSFAVLEPALLEQLHARGA